VWKLLILNLADTRKNTKSETLKTVVKKRFSIYRFLTLESIILTYYIITSIYINRCFVGIMEPYIIEFEKIGTPEVGFISVAENQKDFPFDVKRIYWVYETPPEVDRGNHAHIKGEQIVVVINGSARIHLTNTREKEFVFSLSNRSAGLFIPAMYWRRLELSKDAILLCIASSGYNSDDYIRDYNEFLSYKK
jgi:hypothetical protein